RRVLLRSVTDAATEADHHPTGVTHQRADDGRRLMAIIDPQAGRPARWVELGLMVLALAIGLYAYLQVGLATTGSPPSGMVSQLGVLVVLALGVHVVLRWCAPYADPVILPIAVALNGLGLAM